MRYTRLLIPLLLLLLLTACATAEPVEVTPPFWYAEDPDTGGRVYMLGSMHAGAAGTVYPDYVLEAFSGSGIAAAELDTVALSEDRERLLEAARLVMLPEGEAAADYIGEGYNDTVSFFRKKGLYSSALDSFIPYYWASLAANRIAKDCGLTSENGTEYIFLSAAKRTGKPIYEIESAELQYQAMAQTPLPVQLYMLEQSVGEENYSAQLDEMNELYKAWSSFDSAALEELCGTGNIPPELAEDYGIYYEVMYEQRQQEMAQAVTGWLENGDSVFMLVGAMHFYAEPDIITLLSEEGYCVTEIRNGEVTDDNTNTNP